MKNINLLEQILKLITANFALILSTTVSLVTIIFTWAQTRTKTRSALYQQYLEFRYNTYKDFLDASVQFSITPENRETYKNLIANCQRAAMMSHVAYAETFSHYCAILEEMINRGPLPPEQLQAEFADARIMLDHVLRQEMLDCDPAKHKEAKKIIRRRKHRKLLNCFKKTFAKKNKTCHIKNN